jgi:1,4-dihydroxy-2-naphthoate octaprenyltransferase
MAGLILGIWIITAVGGAFMWSYTTGVGRPESVARSSNLPPLVLFLHPLLGLTGLGIWIAYMYTGANSLAWLAFAELVIGALLGDLLLMRTLRPRRHAVRGAVPPERDTGHTLVETKAANSRLVEDLIPRPIMVVHGLLAVLLMALVLLAALGIDGGDDAAYELFAPALTP